MKPDWSTAPFWAKWLTMDGDGLWQWHEKEPKYSHATGIWYNDNLGRTRYDNSELPAAADTLEARPEGA